MIPSHLKKQIDSASVVSFDCFDTLLVRPYMKPIDAFRHIEVLHHAPGFTRARIFAERETHLKNPDLEEITVDEIYEQIDSQYQFLKEVELMHEKAILLANPIASEIYQYARQQQKRIIVISDSYLSATFLQDVLNRQGYPDIKVFVSCEYRMTKGTGNLFLEVIRQLGISPGDMVHIGDNKISDYQRAIALGIKSFHLLSPKDRLLRDDIRAATFYRDRGERLGTSLLLGVISYMTSLPSEDYWWTFGMKYGGPIAFAYMSWLKRQLTANGIRDIFFVARDGYTLEKVFRILDTEHQFQTAYVYATRLLDAVINLNYEDAVRMDPKAEGISRLKQILSYYRDKDPVLNSETPAEIETCSQGVQFIQKYYDRYQKLAHQNQQDYRKYLTSYIHSDRIAMVDTVTGLFSAQHYLQSFLKGMQVDLKGYYWFYLAFPKLLKRGIIRDCPCESFQKSHEPLFKDWNVMEFLLTAPEPPVAGFENGKVIYKHLSPEEKVRLDVYPQISAGCIAFAEVVNRWLKLTPWMFDEEEVRQWLNCFCTIPTVTDQKMFSPIRHGCDSGHTRYGPLCPAWIRDQQTVIRLFCLFPLVKIKYLGSDRYYRFLGIPLFHYAVKPEQKSILILNRIPVARWRIKENRKKFFLFGIPLIKMKQRIRKGWKEIRIVLCGIPLGMIRYYRRD